MAKQVSFGIGNDIDRLSSLPDDLICHIISFLPLKETIRASILSSRWRYLFTWTSSLTIDDRVETYRFPVLMNLVNNVLFSRSRATIDKFSLKLIRETNNFSSIDGWIGSSIDGWINYALRYGVQELELCISSKYYNVQVNKLPRASWLFTCKTLVRLELKFRNGYILKVRDIACLPKLKVLHLQKIELSHSESVQRLFSRCCMLKELLVQYCKWGTLDKFIVSNPTLKRLTLRSLGCGRNPHSQLVINAPSLVYFEHSDFIADYHPLPNYSLLNLQSLVEVLIDVGPMVMTRSCQTAAADLLGSISNVQSLHLGSFFSRASGLHPFPMFPNLTYLNIKTSFYNWQSILDSSPCLETLVIDLKRPRLDDVLILPKRVPSCLLSHLKAIKFLSFHGGKEELQLVEYFLMNAQVLQNLTVHIREEKKQQSEITKALVTFPRVSKKCHVTIV